MSDRSRFPLPVALDFVPVRRGHGIAGWTLLAAGVFCVGLEVADYLHLRAELDERARQVAILRETHRPDNAATPAEPVDAREREALLRVSSRLDTDWSGVFAALARVRNEDVAWTEVGMEARGDSAGSGLRLTGQARSLDAVLAVLARMRAEPALNGTVLLSHEEVVADGVGLVRFSLAMPGRRAG